MKIPAQNTLRVEDYPKEQRAWLPRLFLPLNQFLTNVTNALNGNITFGDNIPSQDQSLSFTYAGSNISFKWNLTRRPFIIEEGQCSEDGVPVAMKVAWTYDSANRAVVLTKILILEASGNRELTAGTAYTLNLRVVA